MKYAVLDDDKKFLNIFYENIKPYIKNEDIHFYYDSEQLFRNLKNEYIHYDAIFLDIDMPKINGIELSKRIYSEIDNDIIIIFITNKKELIYEAFGLNVLLFVYKPNFINQIEKIIKKIHLAMSEKNKIVVNVSQGKISYKIMDIVYIEKVDRKVYIFTKKDKLICTNHQHLMELNDLLRYSNFIYINRSVILNLTHATKIINGYIMLYNGKKFEISKRRTNEITKSFVLANSKDVIF